MGCSGRIMTGNTSTSLEAYGVPIYIIRNQMHGLIPSLRKILDEYRQIVPNTSTDWIFSGERKHAPLNLANLVRREILPKIEKGTWHGWHGFRRGIATRLHESGAPVEMIQEILRHSDPKVTRDSCIVVKSEKSKKAMQKVDSKAVLDAWKKSR